MKIFKRKHFQALIYSIFLSLPLLSVLGRCVYTIVNKNAIQSYSGTNTDDYSLDNVNEFNNGDRYYFYSATTDTNLISNTPNSIVVSNFEVLTMYSSSDYQWLDTNNIVNISFANNSTSNMYIRFTSDSNVNRDINLKTSYMSFNFTFVSGEIADTYTLSLFKVYNYSNDYYLDNAFEYSIDRFVSENEYGELDFFTWFSSLFLSGNSLDSLYIHFINWYMNYILYVSLGYLIFSVLLWFVNFFRRLVDDTQNINVGGM